MFPLEAPHSIARANGSLKRDHGQLRREIVRSLLADVFEGRLQAGQHLVTQQLSDRFGVSHTPIREAMIALSGVGIVDLVPNRGAIVRKVTPKEVREICQVRRALECEAVRRACGRIDPRKLKLLAAELKQSTRSRPDRYTQFVERARRMDNELHDLIAGSCGNTFLANELGRLKLLFRAFRDLAWEQRVADNDYRRLVEEAHEHLRIVDALSTGNRHEAARAMSRHIMTGGKYWSRAVLQAAKAASEKTTLNGSLKGTGTE